MILLDAEYVARADCAKDVLYLRMLLEFHRPELPKTRARISEDDEGSIKLPSNPICTNRTKHMDVRYHFYKEADEEGG